MLRRAMLPLCKRACLPQAMQVDKAAKPDTGSHGSVIDKLMNAFSEKDDDMVNSFAANAVYVPK